MRRLMLLRHAKSDRPAGVGDHERPLTARGRETAPCIGAYMAAHSLIPDQVICSTARRARETWDIVAKAFSRPPAVQFDKRIYENDAQTLLEVVREVEPHIHVLLLVGHNPSFQELAESLVASGDLEGRRRLHEKFPTAALVVIDFQIDTWERVHPHAGRFDRLITPASLEAETE
jgi:phosphohistidine phosphatase